MLSLKLGPLSFEVSESLSMIGLEFDLNVEKSCELAIVEILRQSDVGGQCGQSLSKGWDRW